MNVHLIHPFDVSYDEARRLQTELAPKVATDAPLALSEITTVAGADVSYSKRTNTCYCAAVVLSYPELAIVEVSSSVVESSFPYIPGLLSFREIPGLVGAFQGLETMPDLLVVDGQGIAHPRRFGLASHLGLMLDIPTIGCAKSRLVGQFETPAEEKGAWSDLKDNGETVGAVLRTRAGVSPVFVSVGHRVDLMSAIEFVLSCCPQFRLPETTRVAHRTVNEIRVAHEA